MKLGIGTYTYMWSIGVEGAPPARPMSAFDLLDKAREFGVKVVQYGPNMKLDPRHVDLLAASALEAGIEIELGTMGLDPAHIEAQVALCKRMNATLLRSVDLYQGPAPAVEVLEGQLRAVLPLLESSGVRLAIENARIPAATMARALDAIGSPLIGITLDTVNSLAIPEGTEHVAATLARHTFCLHVKDFTVKRVWHMMGFVVEGTAAGQGQLDVPWLLSVLREAGVDPNAILEHWVPKQETIEATVALEQSWAVESISYLRRLIAD